MDGSRGDSLRNLLERRRSPLERGLLSGLLICVCAAAGARPARAQMNPYFTGINTTTPSNHLMLMLLSDYQTARGGPDYLTYMGMAEYGITNRWTAGFMAEGEKISGLSNTYGGLRFNTYYQLFPHDQLLHFTLYAEFEDLNQASLYKMEVSGFGVSDLTEPLNIARNRPARTLEQRAIVYHDWGRLNLTFNFISEFDFQNHNDYFGYDWGVFRQPRWTGMAAMAGTNGTNGVRHSPAAPPWLSFQRLGYGLEMMGGLGDTHRFGFFWSREQQYLGPLFTYSMTPGLRFRLEPTFGLSNASDHFVLRMGLDYMINHVFG
jgi:hypothetical protein